MAIANVVRKIKFGLSVVAVLLCLAVIFVNARLYNNIMDIFPFVIFSALVFADVFPFLKDKERRRRFSLKMKLILALDIVLITACITLFFAFKPNYTVLQAEEIIKNSYGIINLESSSAVNNPPPDFLIHKIYVFTGEFNGEDITIYFHPISGDFRVS